MVLAQIEPPPSYSQAPPPPLWLTFASFAIGGVVLFYLLRGVTR